MSNKIKPKTEIQITHKDYFMLALCIWREARNQPLEGKIAVACVVKNRTLKNNTSFYHEITKHWQFSSITAPHDIQLSFYPKEDDIEFKTCAKIAVKVIEDDVVEDPTNGSTLYHDDSISTPLGWNKDKIKLSTKIGALTFYQELV